MLHIPRAGKPNNNCMASSKEFSLVSHWKFPALLPLTPSLPPFIPLPLLPLNFYLPLPSYPISPLSPSPLIATHSVFLPPHCNIFIPSVDLGRVRSYPGNLSQLYQRCCEVKNDDFAEETAWDLQVGNRWEKWFNPISGGGLYEHWAPPQVFRG